MQYFPSFRLWIENITLNFIFMFFSMQQFYWEIIAKRIPLKLYHDRWTLNGYAKVHLNLYVFTLFTCHDSESNIKSCNHLCSKTLQLFLSKMTNTIAIVVHFITFPVSLIQSKCKTIKTASISNLNRIRMEIMDL